MSFVTGLKRLLGTTAFKLSVIYMLASAIFAGALLYYVGRHAQQLIDAQIVQALDTQINVLSAQYRIGGIRRLQAVVERRSRQADTFLFLLQGSAGETVAGNVVAVNAVPATAAESIETTYQRIEEVDGQSQTIVRPALVRVLLLPSGQRLLLGRDLEERARLNAVLGQAIRILIGALLLFGSLGTFFVARRALARMDAMTATSQMIMAGDLSGRLPVSGSGDEIDRLALNLNAMLERIGGLMQGMKEVSDNIAHDLKTPLTRLRNSAEQALRTASNKQDYQAALERTIEESDGLIRTFNALLMIARAEAGSGSDAFVPVDISGLLADFIEMYEPSAEEAGVAFSNDILPDLAVNGSRELLGQVVANLLDNALKYGAPVEPSVPAQISVTTEKRDDTVRIIVADNGAGIAEADRARVLERFTRLDSSRNKPGSGLGLSMVSAVTYLHKGRLMLEDNAPGLRVVLELPLLVKVP
ncbi:MAG: ATP-binding protein [Beijerinckiaceae bacterium]